MRPLLIKDNIGQISPTIPHRQAKICLSYLTTQRLYSLFNGWMRHKKFGKPTYFSSVLYVCLEWIFKIKVRGCIICYRKLVRTLGNFFKCAYKSLGIACEQGAGSVGKKLALARNGKLQHGCGNW